MISIFSRSPSPSNVKHRALAAVIAACLLWGVSFFFGKLALRELPASHVVLGRFVLACLALAPVAVYQRCRNVRRLQHPGRRRIHFAELLPHRSDLFAFFVTGLLMVPITFLLQFEGLARTSATSAALIVGVHAPLLALAAAIFERERLSIAGYLAVALSTAGVVLMVGFPGTGRTWTGDLFVLASMVASVAWVLATKRLLKKYDSLYVTAASMIAGTLALGPATVIMDGMPSPDIGLTTWLSLFVLGIGCTAITYGLWNLGLQHIPASQAGVYINLEPLIGALLGIVLLNDEPGLTVIFGGGIVVISAFVITWLEANRDNAPRLSRTSCLLRSRLSYRRLRQE